MGLARRAQVDLRPRGGVRALRQRHQRDRPLRVQLRRQLPGLAAGARPGRGPLVLVRAAAQLRRLASADALAAIAPGQRVYVVEVGPDTPPAQVTAFAARLRQREPIAALGFSTWPTRAEAEMAAVPWDACVDAFDFGLPQVCTPAQRAAGPRGQPGGRGHGRQADPRGGVPGRRPRLGGQRPGRGGRARRRVGVLGRPVQLLGLAPPARRPRRGPPELPPPPAPPPPSPRRACPRPPEPKETLTPVHFDEPGELTLLANRILAVVQARLDGGGSLTDDELVTDVEDVLRDNVPGGGQA